MQAADSILIVLLLTNFFILGTANLRASIRVVAVQGVLLSLLPLFVASEATLRLIVLMIATAAIKGVLIPSLLLKAIRDVHIRHEVEPYLGFIPSLFLCTIGTGLALLFGDQLPLAPEHRNALFVPAALLYQAMAVEVGILLDLLVGIFVMGIVLNHIQREFSSLDTERLSRLRE